MAVLELSAKDVALKADTGWAIYNDNAKTVSSPLVANNARVQLTCNGSGGATNTTYQPQVSGALWDTSANKILMPKVGCMLSCRVDFTAKAAGNNAYFDWQLDIGDGSPIIIVQETVKMLKGANVEQLFSESISCFALDTFVANGGKFYFDTTADGANISIYDINIHIQLIRVP